MEPKVKEALIRWICGPGPESAHWKDKERFYTVIFEVLSSSDNNISFEETCDIIRDNLKWNENTIQKFVEKKSIEIENIVGFINFLKEEKQINLYNLL